MSEKLDEVSNEYDMYKENSSSRIAELEDKLEKAEAEKMDMSEMREKDFEIESLGITISEKEDEIAAIIKEKCELELQASESNAAFESDLKA